MARKDYEVLIPVTGEMVVVVTAESAEEAVRLVTDDEFDWREEAEPTTEWEIDSGFETYASAL